MITRRLAPKRNTEKIRKVIQASVKLLDTKALEFVQALYDAASKGGVLSAKLLVELATEVVEIEGAVLKNPLRSLALRLAAQPQLPPPSLSESPVPPASQPTTN